MLTKLKTPGTDRRLTLMFTLPLLWTENRFSVFIFIREVLAFKELLGAFHEVAAAGLHFVVSLLVSRCRCSWPCTASLEAKPILWFLLWPPWLLSQSEQSKLCLARTCWLQELNTRHGHGTRSEAWMGPAAAASLGRVPWLWAHHSLTHWKLRVTGHGLTSCWAWSWTIVTETGKFDVKRVA